VVEPSLLIVGSWVEGVVDPLRPVCRQLRGGGGGPTPPCLSAAEGGGGGPTLPFVNGYSDYEWL